MSSRIHFKVNFLRDIAYLIEKRIFWRFVLKHLNFKMVSRCHQKFFFAIAKFYSFL